jgi:signal transduction histidine kinase
MMKSTARESVTSVVPSKDAHCDEISIPRVAAGTHSDLTEEARAAREAVLFGEMRDELAQIRHDLRSSLALISLETRQLAHRFATRSAPGVTRGIQTIAQSAGYIDRVIADLLDLGGMEVAAFELDTARVDLAALLTDVFDRVLSEAERSRVCLEIAAYPTVDADAVRLERVVANLVDNALRYSPPASLVTVRMQMDRELARVDVIDRGPGIPPGEIPYVFERRGGARTRPAFGLGFYVSRRIIEAHGGTIGVDSDVGQGARFFFELPATITT